MATRNKRKLAALNEENCEEHPRNNLASNSNVPRSQEDYITQVSEEIERRVTKKLSQEFSRTENRILNLDVSGCEFEVGAATSEEEAERKKSQAKRALKSPLTAVLESWLRSILHCRFFHIIGSFPVLFLGDAETIPGVSGNEEVSTGVETDRQLRGRHIVVTRSLVPLAGGPSMMSLRLSTVEVGVGSY